MNVRDQLLVQLTAFIDQLSEATDAADSQLAAAHDAKTQTRKETLQKALELCGQRELALEDVVFLDADACTHTATEKERDEAQAAATEHKAINDNLQGQLARLQQETSAAVQQANLQQQQQDQTHQHRLQAQLQAQQAAAAAAATTAEAAAQEQAAAAASAAAAAATEAKANADWLTGFPAEETQLPPKPTTPPDEQQSAFLIRLIMLKQAAKFASLPRMSFEQLQVAPWFMHRLVGDAIWKACWADRSANITVHDTVPQQLLNVTIHVVAGFEEDLKEKATDELRASAARTIAEQQDAQRKRAKIGQP